MKHHFSHTKCTENAPLFVAEEAKKAGMARTSSEAKSDSTSMSSGDKRTLRQVRKLFEFYDIILNEKVLRRSSSRIIIINSNLNSSSSRRRRRSSSSSSSCSSNSVVVVVVAVVVAVVVVVKVSQ